MFTLQWIWISTHLDATFSSNAVAIKLNILQIKTYTFHYLPNNFHFTLTVLLFLWKINDVSKHLFNIYFIWFNFLRNGDEINFGITNFNCITLKKKLLCKTHFKLLSTDCKRQFIETLRFSNGFWKFIA